MFNTSMQLVVSLHDVRIRVYNNTYTGRSEIGLRVIPLHIETS
jgi:hypothetical protein